MSGVGHVTVCVCGQSEERRRDLAAVVKRLEEDLAVTQVNDHSQVHDESSLAQVTSRTVPRVIFLYIS